MLDVKTWSIPVSLSVLMIMLLHLITQSARNKTWHQTCLVSSEGCIIIKLFFLFLLSDISLFFLSHSWRTFLWTSREVFYCFFPSKLHPLQLMQINRSAVRVMRETGWGAAASQSSAARLRLPVWATIILSFLLRLLKQSHTEFDEFSSFTV